VLGEVHMRMDAYEGHEAAVRALSLGRVAVRG
jgi:hypothetical protein